MKPEWIRHIIPDADFTLRGDTYESLQWHDPRPKPTKQEILDAKQPALKQEAQAEAERIALQEILQERIDGDPYLTAIANVKDKIESGEINENASKAIRDELGK